MRIPSRRTVSRSVLLAAVAMTASTALAGLTITNGDFETPGGQSTDVAGWFNYVGHPTDWWLSAWQGPAVSFNNTNVLGLSGATFNPNYYVTVPQTWAYQGIGANDGGLTAIKLQFDLGEFADATGIRDLGVKVDLYKSSGGFVGADNADIEGAAGATLVSTTSVSSGTNLLAGQSLRAQVDLNLAGTSATDQLFLRFSNFNGGTGTTPEAWTMLDNIQFVTGPVHTPVDLTYVGDVAGGVWDNGVTTHFKNNGGVATAFGTGDRLTFDGTGAVDGTGVSTVTVNGLVEPGSVSIDSAHDYVFTGSGVINGTPRMLTSSGLTTGAAFVKKGAGKVTFNVNGFFPAGIEIQSGTVEVTGVNANGLQGGPIVNNGTLVLNRVYTNPTATNEFNPLNVNQEISGTGGLVIKNHAFLGEAGGGPRNNTFTGPVTLEGGFVFLADVNGLGSTSTGTTVRDGATLAVVDAWHLGANAVIAEPLDIAGYGAVTTFFGGGFGTGALFAWEGTRTFSGPINLSATSRINTRGTSNLILSGPLTAAPGAGLEKIGDGTLRITGATLESLTVFAGNVVQTAGTSKLKAVQLEAGTFLDLTTSSLVFDYAAGGSGYDEMLGHVASAAIRTSAAADRYAVGIVDNGTLATPLTSFNGVPVDASAVLMRGTLRGDADLSGTVNFDDLLALAQNYDAAGSGKRWTHGDSNYDGVVNFDDLLALAQNYGGVAVTAGLAASLGGAGFAADWALAQSLVPEPTSLSVMALAATMRRRRRDA